jgi:mono/diheme cytochrome c family protein
MPPRGGITVLLRHSRIWATAVSAAALTCLAGLLAAAHAAPAAGPATSATADEAADAGDHKRAFFEQYCAKCHNVTDWAGGIAFETLSPDEVPADAETWEKVIRKLRGRLMPPPGNQQPQGTAVHGVVSWLETTLDTAARGHAEPGRVGLHRLNRKEYASAVRDLLDVQIDATDTLPRDDAKDGFDNVATALQVSPSFMDQYLAAARQVAVRALGNRQARASGVTYSGEAGAPQRFHVEGLPLGTRGGLAVTHTFPADGEYVLNIANMAQAIWVYNMEFQNHLIVTLDHARIYETVIGGEEDMKAIDQRQDPAVDAINRRLKDIHFTATAGPHEVAVTFLARSYAENENRLQTNAPGGGEDRILRVSSFEVRGPLKVAGLSMTPSRARIFSCYPSSPAEEEPCARQILARLAEAAFRRPLTAGDLTDLMKFYTAGSSGGFEQGIRHGLTAILADPDFLYRTERPADGVKTAAGGVFPLSDLDLASRLSFFLWSSLPDRELMAAAQAGTLSTRAGLEVQVRRMLADPRAQSLASNFAFQWLNMARLGEIQPDVAVFPNIEGDIREDLRQELRLFIDSVFRGNHSVLDLLSAHYTYLNERLALHYGIRDVKGDQFRRVELTSSARYGLLGKGAVLMASSYPTRTAPVLRGQFILDRLLGTPPAAPPPSVPALKENQEGQKALSMRELMALHRSQPSCNACHGIMDPLGFALENFDATGAWRTKDRFAQQPIDASGELPDGTALHGPDDLRAALLARADQFVQSLTEKLMIYALGRSLDYRDMPTVRAIVKDCTAQGYRFEPLVLDIVNSEPFREERAQAPSLSQASATASVHPAALPDAAH